MRLHLFKMVFYGHVAFVHCHANLSKSRTTYCISPCCLTPGRQCQNGRRITVCRWTNLKHIQGKTTALHRSIPFLLAPVPTFIAQTSTFYRLIKSSWSVPPETLCSIDWFNWFFCSWNRGFIVKYLYTRPIFDTLQKKNSLAVWDISLHW